MSSRSKEVEMLLDLVRQLLSVIKDEGMDDGDADRTASKLLVGMDQLMARIDGETSRPKAKSRIKMEVSPPPKKGK